MADPVTYPRRFFVTFHYTSGDQRQEVEEYAQGQFRTIGDPVPVGPQGPTSGQIINQAGFYSDGRPIPGGGQEVVLPLPTPQYPTDTSGPSLGQTQGGLNSPGSFTQFGQS